MFEIYLRQSNKATLAKRSMVNVGLRYFINSHCLIRLFASKVIEKSNVPGFPHLNALEIKFDLALK